MICEARYSIVGTVLHIGGKREISGNMLRINPPEFRLNSTLQF